MKCQFNVANRVTLITSLSPHANNGYVLVALAVLIACILERSSTVSRAWQGFAAIPIRVGGVVLFLFFFCNCDYLVN